METLALCALALGASGGAAGVLAGLLGIGGGLVTVPVLYEVFTVLNVPPAARMTLAVGTSLATIVVTGTRSAVAHARRNAVAWPLVRAWAAPVMGGAILGGTLGGAIDGRALGALFATVALIFAARMVFASDRVISAASLPGEPWRAAMGTGIGAVASLMGIGGGLVSVPLLRHRGFAPRSAVATAAAVGVLVAVPGAVSYALSDIPAADTPPLTVGAVNLLGFVILAPASILGAPWGARLAHTIPSRWLNRVFAMFLLVVATRLLAGVVW